MNIFEIIKLLNDLLFKNFEVRKIQILHPINTFLKWYIYHTAFMQKIFWQQNISFNSKKGHDYHPLAGKIFCIDECVRDANAKYLSGKDGNHGNSFGPFHSETDWEMAQWLIEEDIGKLSGDRLMGIKKVLLQYFSAAKFWHIHSFLQVWDFPLIVWNSFTEQVLVERWRHPDLRWNLSSLREKWDERPKIDLDVRCGTPDVRGRPLR